jgi:hypothetical protein
MVKNSFQRAEGYLGNSPLNIKYCYLSDLKRGQIIPWGIYLATASNSYVRAIQNPYPNVWDHVMSGRRRGKVVFSEGGKYLTFVGFLGEAVDMWAVRIVPTA